MLRETIKGVRLSPQQSRLWQLQRGSTAFRAQSGLLLEGELDLSVMQSAVQELVKRHDVLRTTLHLLPGMKSPLQAINDSGALVEWRFVSHENAEQPISDREIEELFRRDAAKSFDFERGPLLRVTLKALSPQRNLMLITLPSLCADAQSLVILARDTARLYESGLRSVLSSTEEGVQYIQFAEWQNELLEGEEAERGRAYWQQLRLPPTQVLKLACESAPSGKNGFEPAAFSLPLDPAMVARMDALTGEYAGGADTFLLAAWQILLWRLTGHQEVVVGHIRDGREHEMLRDVCGLFARCVPARAWVEPGMSFSDVVQQDLASISEASEWQDFFTIEGVRDDAGNIVPDFFSFTYAFEEWPDRFQAGNISCTPYGRHVCVERFKISLNAIRIGDDLRAEFLYDSYRFQARDIEYLARLFETLVRSVVADPVAPVGELEILSRADRHHLLSGFNSTTAAFTQDKCLHQQFEGQVERSPDEVAVVFRDTQLTYRQLNGAANRVASYLRALGVGPEVAVGLCVERSVEMLIGLLGILKAGGAYLPLDPMQPPERLASILEDAAVPLILTTEELAKGLPEQRATKVLLDSDWEEIAKYSAKNPANLTVPENIAYVIYTSGSTGGPKGVMVQHRSLGNLADALADAIYNDLKPGLKVSLNAPLSFDASVKQWLQLLRGHTLHVLPEEMRFDARELLRYVRQRGIDVLDCTPTHLRSLLAVRDADGAEALPPAVLIGGEAIDAATWAMLTERDGTGFYNLYGLTECTVDTTVHRVQKDSARPVVGRPLNNSRTYLLDEHLKPVPIGVTGEIYIGGEGLARGYLGQPDLTAASFIPDPFGAEGERLYRTGDLARYLPDGRMEFLGRLDHQLKIRGFRVEPGEIEAALTKHPSVKEAVVVPTCENGERGATRLVAYAVLRRDGKHDSRQSHHDDLRGFLRSKLPEFMIPSEFALLDNLPLTRNGKVDRRVLSERAASITQARSPYAAPRTEIERTITDVWQTVLEIEAVGIHDNFFDLGGHSLLVAHAYNQLRERLDREFSMIDMFRYPTVSSLARHLGQEREAISQEQVQARAERQKEALRWQRQRMKKGRIDGRLG